MPASRFSPSSSSSSPSPPSSSSPRGLSGRSLLRQGTNSAATAAAASSLAARKAARDSRARPWLDNSVLADTRRSARAPEVVSSSDEVSQPSSSTLNSADAASSAKTGMSLVSSSVVRSQTTDPHSFSCPQRAPSTRSTPSAAALPCPATQKPVPARGSSYAAPTSASSSRASSSQRSSSAVTQTTPVRASSKPALSTPSSGPTARSSTAPLPAQRQAYVAVPTHRAPVKAPVPALRSRSQAVVVAQEPPAITTPPARQSSCNRPPGSSFFGEDLAEAVRVGYPRLHSSSGKCVYPSRSKKDVTFSHEVRVRNFPKYRDAAGFKRYEAGQPHSTPLGRQMGRAQCHVHDKRYSVGRKFLVDAAVAVGKAAKSACKSVASSTKSLFSSASKKKAKKAKKPWRV